MTTLGIIGAGHIGSALAQVTLDAGYDVVLANSRSPETLADLVAGLAARPSARGRVRAATAAEAAAPATSPSSPSRSGPTAACRSSRWPARS